jgi:hypothetical protein
MHNYKQIVSQTSSQDIAGKVLLVWIATFAAIEPVIIIIMSAAGKTRHHGNESIVIMIDFMYATIAFVKTLYIYKVILKHDEIIPQKDDIRGLVHFITTFVIVRFVLDILWGQVATSLRSKIPIMTMFKNYDSRKKSALRSLNVLYEILLIVGTWWMYWHLQDLDMYAFLVFGVFFVLLLSYNPKEG